VLGSILSEKNTLFGGCGGRSLSIHWSTSECEKERRRPLAPKSKKAGELKKKYRAKNWEFWEGTTARVSVNLNKNKGLKVSWSSRSNITSQKDSRTQATYLSLTPLYVSECADDGADC